MLDEKLRDEIQAAAISAYPLEMCGVLVKRGRKMAFVQIHNIHPNPEQAFAMDPAHLEQVLDGGEYLAVVHSHPDGKPEPSEGDLVQIEETDVPWYILSVYRNLLGGGEPIAGDIGRFEPCGYKAPLLNRQFVHGVQDCYSTIRDSYAHFFDINLPDFPRTDGWWTQVGESLYLKGFQEAGFVAVRDGIRIGDVILMNIQSKAGPNHAAIYLGGDQILHHLYGKLSSTATYGGYWARNTELVLRHTVFLNEPQRAPQSILEV